MHCNVFIGNLEIHTQPYHWRCWNRCVANVSIPLIPDSDYTTCGDDLIPISLRRNLVESPVGIDVQPRLSGNLRGLNIQSKPQIPHNSPKIDALYINESGLIHYYFIIWHSAAKESKTHYKFHQKNIHHILKFLYQLRKTGTKTTWQYQEMTKYWAISVSWVHLSFSPWPISVSPASLHLLFLFLSWTLDSCPRTVNCHLFWFKINLTSALPGSLLLCGLSLHCVVIDSETSGDFEADWLCFCQVQVGSGCRRLDINTTVMKASAGWLKVPLPPIYEGDAHQLFWCNWVDASNVRRHVCQIAVEVVYSESLWRESRKVRLSHLHNPKRFFTCRSLFTAWRLRLSTTASTWTWNIETVDL